MEIAMVRYADEDNAYPPEPEPVILSLQTDKTGHCVLSSNDGRIGGTFINRQVALREVDDRICMSDRVTVIVIEPEKSRLRASYKGAA